MAAGLFSRVHHPEDIAAAILTVPKKAWPPAYDAKGQVTPGAWVAEITGMLDPAA